VAGDAGAVFVKILPDLKEFGSELQKSVASSTSGIADKLSGVGKAMSVGLTLPLVAIGTKAFGAFEESATVLAQTEAALKSTGGAAGVTAQQVGDLATTVSNYSGIDDEAVQSAENMLLTFTNVRNEVGKGNDIFNRATKSVADLATRMAGGAAPSAEQLQSASVQLGKALNDPIKGITALTRVGVSFTEEQKASIQSMVESGNTMGAQKLILAELAKEFGGSAKAFGDSAAGGAAKAKVAFGNAMESIGKSVAPAIAVVAKIAKAVSDWFSGLPEGAQKFIVIIGGVVAAIGPLLLMFGKVLAVLPQIGTAFKALSAILSSNPWAVVIAGVVLLVVLVVKNWDKIKAAVLAAWNWIKRVTTTVWNAILGFLKRFWPILLGVVTGGVGIIVALVIKNWDKIKAFTIRVWNAVLGFLKRWWPLLLGVLTGGVGLVVGLIIKNWSKIKAFTIRVWNSVLRFLKSIPKAILRVFTGAVRWLVSAGRWIVSGLWNGLRAVWQSVSGWFHDIPGHVRDVFASAANWLISAGRAILVGLWNGLKTAWSTVIGWLRGLGSWIKGVFSAAGSWLLSAGRSVLQGLFNGIVSFWSSLFSWLRSLPSMIVSAIGNLGSILYNAGRSVITGLWNGLKSAVGGMFSWLGGIAGKIASVKGPLDKDKRLLTPHGAAIMRGLHKGLRDAWGHEVEPWLRGVSPELAGAVRVGAARASFAGVGGPGRGVAISGTLTLTPDGRAFVEGVIDGTDRDKRRHANTVSRMRRAVP
jgi:phage-related protein